MIKQTPALWSITPNDLLTQFETQQEGLSGGKAKRRRVSFGTNILKPPKRSDVPVLLRRAFNGEL